MPVSGPRDGFFYLSLTPTGGEFSSWLHNASMLKAFLYRPSIIQSNLNSSNTDGSFTLVNSNSFLSPYEILPVAQENKY